MPAQDDEDEAARVSTRPRAAAAGALGNGRDDADDPPRRKAAPVAEEEEETEDRPRRKKKKKPVATGGSGVLKWVLLAVVVLLLAGSGGAGAYFLWFHGVNSGSGNEDPLAFVPAKSEVIEGTDGATLLADSALGPPVEKALRDQLQAGDFLERLTKETGLSLPELFAQTVVGTDLDTLTNFAQGADGLPPPPAPDKPPPPGKMALPPLPKPERPLRNMTVILRPSRPFGQKKVVAACNNATHQKAHGKSYYDIKEGELRTLFMPSDRTLILSAQSGAQLDALFAADGTTPLLSPDAVALARTVDKSSYWGVILFEGKTRTNLDDWLRKNPPPKEWQPLVEPIAKGKGVALWATLQGDQVSLGVNAACADAASASQVVHEAEKTWNQNKLQAGLGAIVMLNAAGLGKTAKVYGELTGNLKFVADGTVAKISSSASRPALTDAISEINDQQQKGALGGLVPPGLNPGAGGGGNKPPGRGRGGR
jgi:hypothetical protein